MHARSTTEEGFQQSVPLAAPNSAQRFLPARWLGELLGLALAGILLGSAALYGVGVLSARVTTPTSSIADGWLRSDFDTAAGTSGFWDDPLLSTEER